MKRQMLITTLALGLVAGFLTAQVLFAGSGNALRWSTIAVSSGKPGDLGRVDALQKLNRSKECLDYVDVSGAALRDLSLRSASMSRASLADCDLFQADFRDAMLLKTDFTDASLIGARLDRATLWQGSIACADLFGASLVETDLGGVDA
ncbi:MAG TPA: pentapeptide repeat-containing protein, partial [Candidatus Methylomirabilis sp.]